LFGYRVYPFWLFSVGFILTGGILYLVLTYHVTADTFAVVLLAVIVGILAGFFTMIFYWLGLWAGSAFVGLLIAAIIISQVNSDIVNWLLVFVLPIVFGTVSLWLQKAGVIVASSVGGAYAVVAAIDYLSKGNGGLALFFPNLIKGFQNIHPNWLTWLLIGIAGVLSLAGIAVQYKMTGKRYQHKPLIDFRLVMEIIMDDDDYDDIDTPSHRSKEKGKKKKLLDD